MEALNDMRWWQTIFALLDTATDTYETAPANSGLGRLYGGQVAAQSLLAAAATVDSDRVVHSLQTSFLHAGDNTLAISYKVERARDSRSMSTRVVTARQSGRTLATSVASFHAAPRGDAQPPIEHEWLSPQADAVQPPPDPETLPPRWMSLADRFGEDIPAGVAVRWPIDMRYVDHVPWDDSIAPPRNRIWLRAIPYSREAPGGDAAALAFATDLPMFEPVCFPSPIAWRDMVASTAFFGATLSHSIFVHRPLRLDDWLLLEQVVPIAHGYRAFCRGEVRSRSGQLVASIAQEVVFVTPRPGSPTREKN